MKIGQILSIFAFLLLITCAVQPAAAGTETIQDNATDYYNLAESAISQGRLENAVQFFDMALAENTTLIESGDALMYIYKDKTAALTDLGKYDEAIVTVNKGLVLFPNSTGMWNNKGWALFKMGQYNDAADAYAKAVSIDPTYFKGWLNMGNALSAAGKYSEAVEAYTTALTLDPESTDAQAGLAEAQKNASSSLPVTTIALVAILVVAVLAAVWYVKFRAPEAEDAEASDKKAGKKKN